MNLSSLCKNEENVLMCGHIAVYEENLLKANSRVSKAEYVDFLKGVGVSEYVAEFLARSDKKITIQNSSFWGKFCFFSIGFAGLCLMINDIKKSIAKKRTLKQKNKWKRLLK